MTAAAAASAPDASAASAITARRRSRQGWQLRTLVTIPSNERSSEASEAIGARRVTGGPACPVFTHGRSRAPAAPTNAPPAQTAFTVAAALDCHLELVPNSRRRATLPAKLPGGPRAYRSTDRRREAQGLIGRRRRGRPRRCTCHSRTVN